MTSSRCRTFRYLLQPTVRQRVALDGLLWRQCELYNAALEERRGAWEWEHRSVSRFEQQRGLAQLRGSRPEILVNGVSVCRRTLLRLDRAFSAFYRRCQAGQTPGYPRFKPAARWSSVEWDAAKGWKLDTERDRLRIQGLGEIKVKLHRQIQGVPKTITIAREGRRWWVSVHCAAVPAVPLPATGREVGIDLGVCSLLATSNGELIEEGRFERRAAERLEDAQRSLSAKQRGSNHRRHAIERVARAHRKIRNQRRDLAHQLSRRLVNDHDLIAHEDLKITNMVHANRGLSRSIHDAGWGLLLELVAYKAESAGRDVVAVNPRHTSQRCAECGHVAKENRVSQAEFRCVECGHTAHADVNAAINILRAGKALRCKPGRGESTNDSFPCVVSVAKIAVSR